MDGRALTMNNLVEVYKSRMVEYGAVDTQSDAAIRIDSSRAVRKRICENSKGGELQNAYDHKSSQRLITNDVKAFAQKYAEENSFISKDAEVNILNKASSILRRRTLDYLKRSKSKLHDFKIGAAVQNQTFPSELISFIDGLLFSQRKLNTERSVQRKNL